MAVGLLSAGRMRFAILLLTAVVLAPAPVRAQEPDPNVNSRYTVEAVDVPPKIEPRLSDSLREDLKKLVGQKFDPEAVDALAERIRKELPRYRVDHKIEKGSQPETVRLVFEIELAGKDKDLVLPRLVYHSRQHFTFGADANFREGGHQFSVGILTDNDLHRAFLDLLSRAG